MLGIKKIGCLVVFACAACASAASVTFTFSYNDNGKGVFTAGSFAVYAFTSPGDNAGLAAYILTLDTGSGLTVRSPFAVFVDEEAFTESRTAGFSALRGASGLESHAALDTFSGMGITQYGIGQTRGDLISLQPDRYVLTSPAARTVYGDGNFNNPIVDFRPFTYGQIPVLLATGTGGFPTIVSAQANVFRSARNGQTEAASSQTAIGLPYIPEPTSALLFAAAMAGLLRRR